MAKRSKASSPRRRRRADSPRRTMDPVRKAAAIRRFRLWRQAIQTASDKGLLSFTYDIKNVKQNTRMITKKTAEGRKNYDKIRAIYDQLNQ